MKHFGAVLTAVIALWFCEVPAAMSAPHIILSTADSGALLATLPLGKSCGFSFEFMNSIYNAPVRETFAAGYDGMITATTIESPSAGVFEYYGIETDGSGRAFINRTFPELRVLSHDYVWHRISSDAGTICMKDSAVNGRPVVIRIGDPGKCPKRGEK